jgi:Zn-finger domain-containing protein
VKNAKNDIERIEKKVGDIKRVLESIKELLDGSHKAQLSTTHGLFKSLKQCLQELQELNEELEPGKTRKTMSRFRVRALKWPFTSKQVERIISSIEGYEQTFTLALQLDQT